MASVSTLPKKRRRLPFLVKESAFQLTREARRVRPVGAGQNDFKPLTGLEYARMANLSNFYDYWSINNLISLVYNGGIDVMNPVATFFSVTSVDVSENMNHRPNPKRGLI